MRFIIPSLEGGRMVESLLYLALILFAAGLAVQLYRFETGRQFFKTGQTTPPAGPGGYVINLVLNTLFQIKLFKAGKIRWVFHFLLFVGFLYLVGIHALHGVTSPVFPDGYDPTIDPFQLLRNVAGLLVLTGCASFFIRRRMTPLILQDKKMKRKGVFSIVLILLVVGSGFVLETAKIISEPVFMEMVAEYSDLDEGTGLLDLKRFWKKKYQVVFAERLDTPPEGLEKGRLLHENYCYGCHSDIASAFISTPLAKAVTAFGTTLNHYRMDVWFYWIHYLLCLLLLVCLPFSRLFHVLQIPFASSRRPLALDAFQEDRAVVSVPSLQACTNCGYCSRVCSVYPNFQISKNKDLLPHWKIESVKAMIKDPSVVNLHLLHSGNTACTLCRKCTDICPSNIDLQSLWTVLDKKLVAMGCKDDSRFIRETSLKEWEKKEDLYAGPGRKDAAMQDHAGRADTVENCIQCSICTNVCPIVAQDAFQNDMTPHQVMNLLRLGKNHLATGTRMVWTCLTCYACQEHCPQEIGVADIILDLRNSGSARADGIQQGSKSHGGINR